MFPGRRHAGRIFFNEVQLSGAVPQVCVLFGPERGRRRLHPRVLRRRDHARRQRVDVPRLAAHGRDGDRREGHARGDGRRARCTPARPAAATSSSRPTRRPSTSPSATSPTSRPTATRSRRPRRRPRPPSSTTPIRELVPADENKPFDMHELIDALVDEGSFLEVNKRWAKELDRRLRAARRPRRRHRRQPAEVQGRRAVRRLRRQGGALHLDLRRVQHPAAVPRRRAGLHDRHRGRAPGDHPPRREDDRGRVARRPCRSSAWSCARPTAPACTRWPARPSSPTLRSRCRRAKIAVMGPRPPSTPSSTTSSRRSRTRPSATHAARS